MKIAFPHMGNLYITAKTLFEELGHQVIVPPYNNDKVKEIGSKYAPEFICLPLKLNLGNFIQAIEMGADTIVMLGGCGPCRFGYYGSLEKIILNDIGYNVDFIVLEPLVYGTKNFISNVSRVFNNKSIFALKRAYKIAKLVDQLERKVNYLRPREKVKGSVDKIYNTFRNNVINLHGSKEIEKYIMQTNLLLDSIAFVDEERPKIAIIGEIYTIIDDYSNLNIQKILGEMGFETDRNLYISSWIEEHLIKSALNINNKEVIENSKGIIDRIIGGHARESIAFANLFKNKGYNGIIHVFPLTCMPEIMAKSIMINTYKDLDIPFMSLVLDEHSSEVGIKTRIEAFADLILNKGEQCKDEGMLSWS
ncbi:acyl-CoA dehydratase activase-related protein [Caldicellulosiruptoraceae bacterium PP1]